MMMMNETPDRQKLLALEEERANFLYSKYGYHSKFHPEKQNDLRINSIIKPYYKYTPEYYRRSRSLTNKLKQKIIRPQNIPSRQDIELERKRIALIEKKEREIINIRLPRGDTGAIKKLTEKIGNDKVSQFIYEINQSKEKLRQNLSKPGFPDRKASGCILMGACLNEKPAYMPEQEQQLNNTFTSKK